MPTLGSRIRKLRKKSELSLGSLEKKIRVRNIHKYEIDEIRPGANAIIALASFFDVSCDWLLLGDDYPRKILQGNTKSDPELNEALRLLQELYQDRGDTMRNLALFTFKDAFSKYLD